ncbi:MAG: hypothetical protein KME15_00350 [Drouetiella hepatica Uher 2000/2452]|jgi:hypothetical protein|uniref:Uncharacterized protein n=1 Tax=Drouetiella hepatica Uher 2000/2452 TaxID=904376 RepID=A0A951Q6N0_9CYAN|nr:hypothetical protein [Drouetiella hepatica Uher 2000/2452]
MRTTFDRDWKPLLSIALISVGVGAIASLQFPQIQRLANRSQTVSAEKIRQEVEVERARLNLVKSLPSFGFNNLLADWSFLSFLQYFGDEPARTKTDYSLSPDYFEVILSRDPYFLNTYTFASTSISLYAGMPEKSVVLMQQGLQSLKPNVPPGSYYAWRQLGIDQLLFLGDAQAARQSFATAATWARLSSLPGSADVADSSQQTVDFLTRNPNSKTAQVSAWTMILSTAPDDRTQKMAIDRIEALGSKVVKTPDGTYSIQAPEKD